MRPSAMLKPSWPMATVFLRCDTCLDGFNLTYLLCPECVTFGKRRQHRQGRHSFSACCAATATHSDATPRASKKSRLMDASLLPFSRPVDAPLPAVSSSSQCEELKPESFESVAYCDANDVLISWNSEQPDSDWRLRLTQQGKFSLGQYANLLLACFQRQVRAYQQQQQQSSAHGHDAAQFLHFASFSSTGVPMSSHTNLCHPAWMNAQADVFDSSTGLFSPRGSRDLLAAHGGFLLCPARRRKGDAAVETRDVVMSNCYTVDSITDGAAQERYLLQRWGDALWSLQPPFGALFHLPTFSELSAFVHRHMRHGTFDLPELLRLSQAQKLDETCQLLERMVMAAMRCDSALSLRSPFQQTGSWSMSSPLANDLSSTSAQPLPLPFPLIAGLRIGSLVGSARPALAGLLPLAAGLPFGPLADAASPSAAPQLQPSPMESSAAAALDALGDELQQLQSRLAAVSSTLCRDWLLLLHKDVRLEDLPLRRDWSAWQERLGEVERDVGRMAQMPELRQQQAVRESALRAGVRRRADLRSAVRSGVRPEGDRVTISEKRNNAATADLRVSPAFQQWPCDVRQVVSASFTELVLDPDVNVLVLAYQNTGRFGMPVDDGGLFHHLLSHVQAMSRIVLLCASQQQQQQQQLRLRLCLLDCRENVNALDPSWLPQPCFHYWHGFREGGLLCFPAKPVSEQLSFADEGQQLQPERYDWSWAGRIHTACFRQPDAHYLFRTPALLLDPQSTRPATVFPVWVPSGYQLQSLQDFLSWSHQQLATTTAEPFDLQEALLRADGLTQRDEICRELRSALLQYRQWENLSRAEQGPGGAEPEDLWSLSSALHQQLPPAVALHEFDAAACRAQFSPFLHFVNSRCLPRLQLRWNCPRQRGP